jgi:hypothetical protein
VSKDCALDVTKGANMPVLNKGKAIVETPVEARAGFLNRPVLWVLVSGGAICFDLLGLLHRVIGLGGPPAIGAALLLMDCLVWDPTVLGCRWAEVGLMGSHGERTHSLIAASAIALSFDQFLLLYWS